MCMDFCAGTGHKKNKEENNRKHIDIYGNNSMEQQRKKTETILHNKTNKSEKSRAASPLRPQFGLTSVFEILRRHQHTQLHEVQEFLGHGQPWDLLLIYDTLWRMNTKEKTIELHVSTTGTSTT